MNQVASRQLSKDMPQEPPILISNTSPLPSTTMVANKSFQWPTSASQYGQGVLIGKGTFSSVYTGICKNYPKQPQKICIKIMDLENIIISFEEILQEISMMRLCDDPNILTCFTNFVVKDQLWLILQLMNKGSALRVMSISKLLGHGEGLSEDCLAYIIAETLKGIHYLHSRSLIHRDIKSGNILLDSQGIVKLSDLAFSGWTVEIGTKIKSRTKTLIGSPCFIAPEVLLLQQQPSQSQRSTTIANVSQPSPSNLTSNKISVETNSTIPSSSSSDHLNTSSSKDNLNASSHGGNESNRPMSTSTSTNNNNNALLGGAAVSGGYDNRADIWSLGITCLELAKGYPPYANLNSTMAIVKVTIDSDPPSLKSYPHDKQLTIDGQPFSKNYDDFIKKCLQKNPKYRPSASELLKHRFVRTNSNNNSSEALIKFLSLIPDVDDIHHEINQQFSSLTNSINNDLYNDLENIIGNNNEFENGNIPLSYSTESTPMIINRTPGQYFTSSSIASSPAHPSSSFQSSSFQSSSTSSPDYSKTPSRNNSYRNIRTFSTDSNPSSLPIAAPTSLSGKHVKESNGSDKIKSIDNNNRSRNNSWAFQFPETELIEDDENNDHNFHEGIAEVGNDHNHDVHNLVNTHTADIPIPVSSSPVETYEQSNSFDKDETRSSSSYVPGTTWVFDTKDLRDGKVRGKSEETTSKNNSNTSNMKTINEDQEHDRDGIEDFLNEFEMDEATLR
jgi:serine/threonine protein kinase